MNVHYLIPLLLMGSYAAAQTENIPCPRNQPVIVYHQKEKAIYLFGGYCSRDKKRLNDLWKFDGQSWTPVTTKNAPPARSGHSMVYDAFENRLLVFGGKNDAGELLNDVWSWDGEEWTEIPGKSPEPRQSHRMTFNPKDGTVLLFGGSSVDGKALSDTWLFEDDRWISLESKNLPSPRLQHTLNYDPLRNVMVLFGGFNRNNGNKEVFGDTWEWYPSEGWKLKADNEEMARDHHAMAFDIGLERIILFGGYNEGYLGDTWSWDGIKWTKLSVDNQLARAGKPGLVYDSMKEAMVLFGGWDRNNQPLMDFWQFNTEGRSWDQY